MRTTGAIANCVEALRKGRQVYLWVDNVKEPYGVAVYSAQSVSPQQINDWAHALRGVICVAIGESTAARLGLEVMPGIVPTRGRPEFLVSVEARRGVTTGISAADRARTLNVIADERSTANDVVSPGHIFPVCVRPAGVLGAASEAEGAYDLIRIATQGDAAAYCHILGHDGALASEANVRALAAEHDVPMVSMVDLVHYRMAHELFVHTVSEGVVSTQHGPFRVVLFKNELDGLVHPVLVMGEIRSEMPVLVRVHSQCLTGDVFHSWRCDCGEQLSGALAQIQQEGCGVVVYLRQEGRGIGLLNKVRAYSLQDRGKDTVDANLELGFGADDRIFVAAAQILRSLGVNKVRLMTNNIRKIEELTEYGLEVVERVPLGTIPHAENLSYLKTKQERLGHMLNLE